MKSCRSAGIPSAHGLSGNAYADKMSAVPVKSCLFVLSDALQLQLIAEARAAYRNECCGLIEGVRAGDTIEAIKLHPTRNLAAAADRFEIDPAEHIHLLRALRGTGREIVGCYHSHPDGRAQPSARDRDSAGEENFVWLIAALDAGSVREIAGWLFADGAYRALRLA
jgi:desampylase